MTGLQTIDPVAIEGAVPSAVAWINGRHASVVAVSSDGRISACEITRGWMREQPYLAQVVRVIGDRQRVMILGPSSVRLALEREYVAMYRRRPDRLVDVEPAGPVSLEELVDRVRTLAA
jgi:hypothetical protein